MDAKCSSVTGNKVAGNLCLGLESFCSLKKAVIKKFLRTCWQDKKPDPEMVFMRHHDVKKTTKYVPKSYVEQFLVRNEQIIKKSANFLFKNNIKLLAKVSYNIEDILAFCKIWAVGFLASSVSKETNRFIPENVNEKLLFNYLKQRFAYFILYVKKTHRNHVVVITSEDKHYKKRDILNTYPDNLKLVSSYQENSIYSDYSEVSFSEYSRSFNDGSYLEPKSESNFPKKAVHQQMIKQRIVEKLASRSHEEAIEILNNCENVEDTRTLAAKLKSAISSCKEDSCVVCLAKKRTASNNTLKYLPQQVEPTELRKFIEEFLSIGKSTYGKISAQDASKKRYKHDLTQTARMLGLLVLNGDSSVSPSELAYLLCKTKTNSKEEQDMFKELVSKSNTLKPFNLLENPADNQEDALHHYSHILVESGLNISTAAHRAHTLLLWCRFLNRKLEDNTLTTTVVKEMEEKPYKSMPTPPVAPAIVENMFKQQAKFRQLAF